MKRILLVLAALFSLGLTSLASVAHGQVAGSRFDTRDNTARIQHPADFVVSVDSLVARLAAKRTLVELDSRWRTARLRNDTVLLDSLLADDWTSTGSGAGSLYLDGLVESKTHYLAELQSGQRSYESIVEDEQGVRIRGDTGLVIGRTTSRGYLNDEFIVATSQFTRTYARRGGRWQMISSHTALIVPL